MESHSILSLKATALEAGSKSRLPFDIQPSEIMSSASSLVQPVKTNDFFAMLSARSQDTLPSANEVSARFDKMSAAIDSDNEPYQSETSVGGRIKDTESNHQRSQPDSEASRSESKSETKSQSLKESKEPKDEDTKAQVKDQDSKQIITEARVDANDQKASAKVKKHNDLESEAIYLSGTVRHSLSQASSVKGNIVSKPVAEIETAQPAKIPQTIFAVGNRVLKIKASLFKEQPKQTITDVVEKLVGETKGLATKKQASSNSATRKDHAIDASHSDHSVTAKKQKADLRSSDTVSQPVENQNGMYGRVIQSSDDQSVLDAKKWNVVSSKVVNTAVKGDAKTSAKNQNGNFEGHTDSKQTQFQTDALKSLHQPASANELETGVRNGLNELVKKANVQIKSNGTATAQIRMNPEHLGFMSVDMKVENNRVILKILVDRKDVLDQLKKDIDILKADFTKSGLQIDSVSMKLREPFESSNQFDNNDHNENRGFDFNDQDQQDQSQQFTKPSAVDSDSYFEQSAVTYSHSDKEDSVSTVEADAHQSLYLHSPINHKQANYEDQLVMNLRTTNHPASFQA